MSEFTAEAIEKELSGLWASLEQSGQGVVRACAMTLLVFADESDDPAAIGRTLAELMRVHPHRAILVRIRAGAEHVLEHSVQAQCWMPFGGREQVCCEVVEFVAGERNAAELSPILTALAAPDLPVISWHRGARAPDTLGMRVDKRIVDSGTFPDAAAGLAMLAAETAPVADLSWGRITCWREMVAQTFENASCRELLPRIDTVRVRHSADRVPPEAWYLAGWIVRALGRELRFELERGATGARIEALTLTGPEAQVGFTRHGSAVLIESGSLRHCGACPDRSDAELLGAEIGITGRDTVFLDALGEAAKLARGGR